MSLPINNVLQPLTAGCLDVLKESASVRLKNSFQVVRQHDLHETVLAAMTDNFLIISYVTKCLIKGFAWLRL